MSKFSILVCCYGDFPQYSLRCIYSILENCNNRQLFDLHVGCSACSEYTIKELRKCYDKGFIDTLIESKQNINKDPMMRLLIERTESEYFVWLDDDSHFNKGWDSSVLNYISSESPFDAAGHVFFIHRTPEYMSFVKQRKWWRGDDAWLDKSHIEATWFPTGGLWIGRTAFFRQHDFPDKQMVKRQDDLLVGDLISQQHGILKDFGHNQSIMSRIKISDGNRRGSGEGSDGWKA